MPNLPLAAPRGIKPSSPRADGIPDMTAHARPLQGQVALKSPAPGWQRTANAAQGG